MPSRQCRTASRRNVPLVTLKRVRKASSLASRQRCQRQFFAPNSYHADVVGAEQNLRCKFDLHKCQDEPVSG
jgi:hypothetical protein